MVAIVADVQQGTLKFRTEFRDFLWFLRHPSLSPRTAGRRVGSGVAADWFSGLDFKRLLQWALLLWGVNLIFLGPIAVMAAGAGGAQHRLDIGAIPWLQALLWAPLVEEMVFRYSLRRIGQAFWVLPSAAVVMFNGPGWSTGLFLLAILLLCWRTAGGWPSTQQRLGRRAALQYRRVFPWAFYAVSLAFAAVHLMNFKLHQTPLWLMPLLVLPQLLTGLVLGWMRVRRGIGASISLHALFNGGPLLVVWLILQYMPQVAN